MVDEEPTEQSGPLGSLKVRSGGDSPQDQQGTERELRWAKQELEQRTQELARSVASLRATLEGTTDGVLVLAADHALLHFNENFLRVWDLPASSLVPDETLLELLARRAAQPEQVRERFSVINQSQSEHSVDTWKLADGRVLECHSRPRVLEGASAGRVWSFRDVTQTRRTQEQLEEEARVMALLNATGKALASKLDLPSLLQAVTDAGTALSGAQFGAFFPNPACAKLEALLPRALSGSSAVGWAEIKDPGTVPLFEPTFRGGPPLRSDDVQEDARSGVLNREAAGGPAVRSYLAVPILSRGGEVLGGLFFGHSLAGEFDARTERIIVGVASQAAISIDNARLYEAAQRASLERQSLLESERSARAAAERLSALKDEFLANLSHELRTPLNAIVGWSEMLQHGRLSQAEMDKGLATIERNARVQTQLVEDLLDMSRILSGKVRLEVQSLEPISFIEAAVDTLRPAAHAKDIRIEMLVDSAVGAVSGDRNRLQQVMWNLLSNAIKFTPKGGRVRVSLQQVSSQVEIRVADTGIGISSDFLPYVFDRFRQASAGSTRRHGGLGLGLSIVRHLVELHGGVVRAESPGPDRGSSFLVRLPVAALRWRAPEQGLDSSASPSVASVPTAREGVNLSGVKVLVVEDDADSRDLLQGVLAHCAATVRTAASAAEGLALVNQEPPDVLVSDIGMPDVDGFEFLRRVRALDTPQGRRIPAIALTAYARSEDRTRALRAGFLAHMAKPVQPSELVATVASVVGRSD
jgi:signal transduction histidine kinase/CheY-like chemotaxis protein